MQALVLAGGEGTRLRPLTRTVPKPVMPLAGRPFLTFMLDWLRSHGVTEVILSCGFLSDGVHAVLGRHLRGHAPALRDRARAAGHRRAGPAGARRGPARGPAAGAQRRRADRHGPDRRAGRHTEQEALGHAGADRRRGHVELRRGPDRRRRLGAGVPREVRRPGAHQPHQRRRLRARALGGRGDPRGPRGLLRARGLPGAGGPRAARLAGRGLLGRHRHARPLPRGHLRPAGRPPRQRPARRATRPAR